MEVLDKENLCGLEFEVAGEMGAADAAAQGAFLLPEELLEDVVGAVNDAEDMALGVAPNRVSEQMRPMSIESVENNALGRGWASGLFVFGWESGFEFGAIGGHSLLDLLELKPLEGG